MNLFNVFKSLADGLIKKTPTPKYAIKYKSCWFRFKFNKSVIVAAKLCKGSVANIVGDYLLINCITDEGNSLEIPISINNDNNSNEPINNSLFIEMGIEKDNLKSIDLLCANLEYIIYYIYEAHMTPIDARTGEPAIGCSGEYLEEIIDINFASEKDYDAIREGSKIEVIFHPHYIDKREFKILEKINYHSEHVSFEGVRGGRI